ncbi:MAG: hypothetical protein ACSHX0_02810 [Akkermansiaceae bacterium]
MKTVKCPMFALALAISCGVTNAELGDNASWLRGALGLMWHPSGYDIELIEQNDDWMSIEPFLEQVDELDVVDYIQLNLNDAASLCASHTAPHARVESMMGDVLIVPRAASGADPFEDWLIACKARGLRTQIYVNSGCLLYGDATIATRWKNYCNSNAEVRNFINSESYHTMNGYPDRQYMFAYGEFVLKEYSERYGDLIDAWLFDTARLIASNGDSTGGTIDNQRLFENWANACRAGNANAAVAFNHGVGTAANPFAGSTLVGDYTFGHPFGGLNNPTGTASLYARNFSFCEKMGETNGHVYSGGVTWNDKVMGHYYPKMSTTRWNNGTVAALTNQQFLEWNQVGLSGGAISWGVPLNHPYTNRSWLAPDLRAKDWAFDQLKYMNDRITVSKEKYVQLRKADAQDYCINGGRGGSNGQDVMLWTYIDNHRNLTWEEVDRGDGWYSYKKKGTNYCLDGGNGGAFGQEVYLWLENANNFNQHWKKIPTGDGTFKLSKRNAPTFGIRSTGGANYESVFLGATRAQANNKWFIEYK